MVLFLPALGSNLSRILKRLPRSAEKYLGARVRMKQIFTTPAARGAQEA